MPNPAAGVRTVGDELALASELKGREIPLEAARKAMVKAAGERSPVNPFHFRQWWCGHEKSRKENSHKSQDSAPGSPTPLARLDAVCN
jgi:hypothetical protein